MRGNDSAEEEIKRIFTSIYADHSVAAAQIGWLAAALLSENLEKADGSHSGHAIIIAEFSVSSCVMLFLQRQLEDNGDSLFRAISLMKANESLVIYRHASGRSFKSLDEPITDVVKNLLTTLSYQVELLRSDQRFKQMRIFRDSFLAHRLSRFVRTKKTTNQGLEDVNISMRDTVEMGQMLLRLTGLALQVWEGGAWEHENRHAKAKIVCDEFWRVMPELAKVEKIDVSALNDLPPWIALDDLYRS